MCFRCGQGEYGVGGLLRESRAGAPGTVGVLTVQEPLSRSVDTSSLALLCDGGPPSFDARGPLSFVACFGTGVVWGACAVVGTVAAGGFWALTRRPV